MLDIFLALILATFLLQALIPNNTRRIDTNHQLAETKIAAQNITKTCAQTDREKCYVGQFTSITRSKGLEFAQKTLYDAQDIDPKLRDCHVLSHKISDAATQQHPEAWRDLIERADIETCGGGFLHGVIETHIGYDPKFTLNRETIADICNQGKRDYKERSCSHIMGHLLLVDANAKVDPALSICNQIVDPTMNRECATGVFMEDSFKTILADHGLAQIPVRDKARMDRQTSRCLNYQGLAGEGCWVDLAEIFAEFYNFDPPKVYESCYSAPTKSEAQQCYMKAVILMADSANFDSSSNLLAECTPYTSDTLLYKQCTDFIVSSLMHYSPKFTNRGVALCSNIGAEFQEYCFRDLGQQLKVTTPALSDRQELCTGTPEKYLNLCAQS